MVAGKVKNAMGFQKSPANPKPDPTPKPPSPSPSSAKVRQMGAAFSRSFSVYFPRASAQVQPRPPDVTELLHLVEQLRERESRLKTELLEQKLLKESAAIVPNLENEISKKNSELERSAKKIGCLEDENERLREEVEMLHSKLSERRRENDDKIKALEIKISELKKAQIDKDCEEMSTSQRFQGLIDASCKASLMKNLKKNGAFLENYSYSINEEQKAKEKAVEAELQPRLSRSNSSEEITELVVTERSRVPRVPKPPPRPSLSFSSVSSHFSVGPLSPNSSSSSSSSGSLAGSADRALTEPSVFPPPPPPPPLPLLKQAPHLPPKAAPPPPPPPPKRLRAGAGKVRRVPEVVEFYHSLMRRDSRRESGSGGATDVPADLNLTVTKSLIFAEERRTCPHLCGSESDYDEKPPQHQVQQGQLLRRIQTPHQL